MNYLDRHQLEHENSLTPLERQWVVMDISNEDWKIFDDRHDAEMYYESLKDEMENVEFGYTYEGRFNSRWSDNVNEFVSVRL